MTFSPRNIASQIFDVPVVSIKISTQLPLATPVSAIIHRIRVLVLKEFDGGSPVLRDAGNEEKRKKEEGNKGIENMKRIKKG